MIIIPGKIKMLSNGSREVTIDYRVSASLFRSYQMYCTYSNHVEDMMAVVIGVIPVTMPAQDKNF